MGRGPVPGHRGQAPQLPRGGTGSAVGVWAGVGDGVATGVARSAGKGVSSLSSSWSLVEAARETVPGVCGIGTGLRLRVGLGLAVVVAFSELPSDAGVDVVLDD